MTPENWYILWFVTVVLEFFSCHLFHESAKSWENMSDLVIVRQLGFAVSTRKLEWWM
jgi:hypothetical protein